MDSVTTASRSLSRIEGGKRTHGIRATGTPEQPLVSVITVVYNRRSQIEETILAVLGQSYSNIEYIVIDGGSADGTLDVLRKYDDRIDYWVSEPDSGIYDAMNKGIELVVDPEAYVVFANSDDRLFSPEVVERMVKSGRGADLIYGRMQLTDGDAAAVIGHEIVLNDLAFETAAHPSTLTRRKVFDEVGKFDTSYQIAGDHDFIVRCFAHPVSTQFVDEIVARAAMGGRSEEQFRLSCRERKRVVRTRFKSLTRLAGVSSINLYAIPRSSARYWLMRAGLLGRWRSLRRFYSTLWHSMSR